MEDKNQLIFRDIVPVMHVACTLLFLLYLFIYFFVLPSYNFIYIGVTIFLNYRTPV